jgi:hypothetical protein
MRPNNAPGCWVDVIDDDGEFVERILLPPEPQTRINADRPSNDAVVEVQDYQEVPSPIGHLAQCGACLNSQDLIYFYEPGRVFTTCLDCRLIESRVPGRDVIADVPVESEQAKYECRCGSTLRMQGRQRHEASRKHKQWRKGHLQLVQ